VGEAGFAVPLADPDAEGIDPERRRVVQERRLRSLVDRLLAADGLQAGRLRDVGISAGAGVGLDDLARLPMVTKQDLWEHYPTGLRAVDEDQIVCIHGSSGTGGRPTLVPYTAQDVDVWAQVMARALGGAGATRRSLVHNAYGYGLFTGGLGVHHGAIRLGATVLPISGGMTDRQVRLIADLRPDILTCTPSYAIHLGEALLAAGVEPTFSAGVFGAEPWTDSMRGQIERLLGLRALDIYGLSEIIGPGVACESLDSGGLLNVAEDHFYVEAVDETEPIDEADVGGHLRPCVALDGSKVTGTVTNSAALNSLTSNDFVMKTGDTMTGTLNLPVNGLNVGVSQNQFIMSGGLVGIGRVPSPTFGLNTETLQVNGNIGVPATKNYTFDTPQVRRLTIGPEALVTANPTLYSGRIDDGFVSSNVNGLGSLWATGGTGGTVAYFVAPVQLPDGAIINGLTAQLIKNGGSLQSVVELYRSDSIGYAANTANLIATATTTSSAGLVLTVNAASINSSFSTVDNTNYRYFIRYSGEQNTQSLRFCAARITYLVYKVD